jgi:hypothetical protein
MSSGVEIASLPTAFAGALRGRLARAVQTLWPAAIVLAVAALTQGLSETSTDVSWLITLCEKTLRGERPYVDFIESNPPAAIFLYMPGTFAARLLDLRPEFMVGLTGFLAIVSSLALCAAIFARAELLAKVGPVGLAIAAAVLALLPSRTFDQREHLALVAGLPLIAAMIARAWGARVPIFLAVAAGLGGAIMAAVKPYFALTIVAALPYVAWRVGLRALLASLEFYATIAFGAFYVALVVIFFPDYVEHVAPIVMAVYVPVRESWLAMLGSSGFLCWLLLGVYLIALSRNRISQPLVAVPALASLGAVIAFLIQGKAWPYQSYPAIALMALALGLALRDDANIARRFGLGAACFFLLAAIARLTPATTFYALCVAMAICALFLVIRAFTTNSPRWRAPAASLTAPAVASAIAFAFAWFSHQNGSPPLQAAAATFGPHPKILAITQDPGVGYPFARQVGGVWAQRVPMLWITSGARRLLEDSKDPSERARLESYLQFDRNMLIEDIRSNRPDIILISNRFGEFRRWAFADPLIAAALADYKLYAEDGDPNGESFLYVRADLIPLRSSLSDTTTPDTEREP